MKIVKSGISETKKGLYWDCSRFRAEKQGLRFRLQAHRSYHRY